MPGAGHKTEELRYGVEKVEYLRHEEEQERLAEVPQDANHSKRHTSKVAKRVAHKHSRWIPTLIGEGGMEKRRGRGSDQLCLRSAVETARKGSMM